jgi:hypothetical protein
MSAVLRRVFAVLLMLGLALQASQAATPRAACAGVADAAPAIALQAAGDHAHHAHHDGLDAASNADRAADVDDAAGADALCDAAQHVAMHHAASPGDCDHCQHCGAAGAALMPASDSRAAGTARTERLPLPQPRGWASITPEPLHRPPIERAA